MSRNKTIFLIIIICLAALLAVGFYYKKTISAPDKIISTESYTVTINSWTLNLEIADNLETRARGLSGRTELSDNYGMLFIFPYKTRQTFWMKDMLIPIDIIWIKDNKIIGIEKNVPPEPGVATNDLKLYQSPDIVDYVLEVKAGLSDAKGWQVGQVVNISGY